MTDRPDPDNGDSPGSGDAAVFGDGCDCELVALRSGRVMLNRTPRCVVHGPAVRAQRDQFRAGLDEIERSNGEFLDALAAAASQPPRRGPLADLRRRLRRR